MTGYYIKETRSWWKKNKPEKEEIMHGNLRYSSKPIIHSKKYKGLHLFETIESAERFINVLKEQRRYGNFNSEWEVLCEDIQ